MIVANENHGRKLFITGEGKSGTVGQRMAASLTSLGISSQFVPAIEWAHGDLGHLSEGDCVFLISHSGKNKDVMGLIDTFKKRVGGAAELHSHAQRDFAGRSEEAM